MTQKQDREIEIKYVLPSEATLARFMEDARSLRFPGLQAKQLGGPFNRNDTYYDTEKLDLLRGGKCFRVGGKSERMVRITFKEGTANSYERVEIQDNLTSAQADSALQNAHPSRAFDAFHESVGYKPLVPKLRVYKMFYSLWINDCEIIFGYTVFAGRRGAMERIDLEIEAKGKATVETVKQVGAILAPRFNLILDMRSKYEVGMALVG